MPSWRVSPVSRVTDYYLDSMSATFDGSRTAAPRVRMPEAAAAPHPRKQHSWRAEQERVRREVEQQRWADRQRLGGYAPILPPREVRAVFAGVSCGLWLLDNHARCLVVC